MSQHTEKLVGLLAAQAMALADQHLRMAHEASEQIRQELQAKLRKLEEGEEQRYQLEAERLCRQIIQASKLRIDSEHDRLRWALAQDVLAEVHKRLEQLTEDTPRYHAVLQGYLAEAAQAMPAGDLIAELNPRDLDALRPHWERIVAQAAPGRKVELAPLAEHATGGMRVRSADGRLRVDNTFEGRLARMQDDVLAVIMDKLFNRGGAA
ncbi:MAG: V-type ATP synthase subunit E family protein [Pseudomonadota bacterium]